jgi:hypothetical protein
MANHNAALLRAPETLEQMPATTTQAPSPKRNEGLRHHVLNRLAEERSGRLYCNEEWEFEIPSLEIYAAR